MNQRNATFLVLACYCLLFLLPLGLRPPFEPDETRYAEVPREMIASGDWVVSRLNGLRYFEKPVLGYWLTGAAMQIFGDNIFAVRLPSALTAGLSGLLVYLLARRRERREDLAGPLAALVFLTCFEVIGVGTFAVLDTMLTFFLTGAMFFFYRALEAAPSSGRERRLLAWAGFFCGLAFLLKGFLAFVVPALAVGGYLLWQGRGREIFRLVWLPLAAAILVALPWGLAIHQREPDFWNYFFWNEHVRRFLGNDAQHSQSFWFFFLTAPAMLLPWIFLAPAACSGWVKRKVVLGEERDLLRFCLCWFALPFLFFSACSGKLLTYILPCFPPFAVLLARGLLIGEPRVNPRFFRWGAVGAGVLFALVLAALLGVQLLGYGNFRPYSQTGVWLLLAGALAAAMVLFFLAARREGAGRLFLFGLAPGLLFLVLPLAMPDLTLVVKAPSLFLDRHRAEIGAETIVISDEDPVRAVCWSFKRDNVFLLEGAGELIYGVQQAKDENRLLTPEAAGEMILANPGRTVLIVRKENFARWEPWLPDAVSSDSSGAEGYLFLRY